MALADIPGYGAYVQRRAMNEAQPLNELKQVGALQELLAHSQSLGKEAAFRKDLAALGDAPTQDALAAVAAKYAPPAEVLKSQTASADRKAALEMQREMKQATLKQAENAANMTHEFRMSRLSNEADRAAETKRHNEEMEAIRSQLAEASKEKPPSGYRKTAEGNLEAIPGGPADTKLQGQLNQDTAVLSNSTSNMDRLATAANELLHHPGLGGITGIRGSLPNIPGTPAADAQAKLDTLKSQVGFSVLQDMRNNSKTGGALGQVSDAENKLLQSNLAALANAQSEAQMRESLQKIIDFTAGSKERLRQAYNLKHGDKGTTTPGANGVPEFASDAEATAAAAAGKIKSGDRIKVGGKPGTWH